MERYQDINELLSEISNNISQIESKYEQARQNDNLKVILRPLVKSTLEHLRSILEYAAQDIWHSYNPTDKTLYFPYGKDRKSFNKNLNKNLPDLKKIKPKIYNLIASLQPYKCQDNWLIELCNQTNFHKHNKLALQKRVNSRNSKITIANIFQIDSSSSITFSNCSLNGTSLDYLHITGDMDTQTIKKQLPNDEISISKEFDWVEFQFENTTTDTLQLIQKSYINIQNFIDKLYKIIKI
jgi:hypothetical protein